MTKVESGDLQLANTAFNLNDFVNEIYRKRAGKPMPPRCNSRQNCSMIRTTVQCWVFGDKQRIGQVLAQ
ncbi:MAG: hypothetical protein U5M23_08695 [Marinagarivorans sp.]|nr:hypothetical protein [Marinagarivorans sp.]